MRVLLLAGTVAIGWVIADPAMALPLVTNGGFDNVGSFVVNDPSGGMRLQVGSQAITGWTVVAGSILWTRTVRADGSENYAVLFDNDAGAMQSDSTAQAVRSVGELISGTLTATPLTTPPNTTLPGWRLHIGICC